MQTYASSTHTHTQAPRCIQRQVSQHTLTQQREYMRAASVCLCVRISGCVRLRKGDGRVCVCVCASERDRRDFFSFLCESVRARARSKPSYLAAAQTPQNHSDSAEVQTLTQVLWEFLLQTIQKKARARDQSCRITQGNITA